MRRIALLALIACGDKRQADPVTPGSSTVVALDAAPVVVEPSRIALRAGGKPPVKTTKPIGREQLTTLSTLELAGLTARLRKLDDAFLDVEYTLALPIVVGVTVQPCLRCLPMRLDTWRAETDALRVTVPPELRDRSEGTSFEVTSSVLGGATVIATYQLAVVPGAFDQAVTVYWNDGVNQLRVNARSIGKDGDVERRELEQLALAVLDRYAQSW